MNFPQKYLASCLLMSAALLCSSSPGVAQIAPDLGSAADFEVLAGTSVTCTNSTVNGDVGAGIVVTETTCSITGEIVDGDATDQALMDFTDAFDDLAGETCDSTLTGTLAGTTVTPGVYCVDSTAKTGTFTLDAQGDPNAVFIFLVDGSTGTGALTGTSFNVVAINGANPCNVYWQVDAAATLTNSTFRGTILAGAAITMTDTVFTGDAYAGAAVTLTRSNVTGCVPADEPLPDDDPPKDKCKDRDHHGDKDRDHHGDKDRDHHGDRHGDKNGGRK